MHLRYLSSSGQRTAIRQIIVQSTLRTHATAYQLPAAPTSSSSACTRSFHGLASIRCFALSGSSSPKPLEKSDKPFNLADSLSTLGNDFANARMDIEDAVESVGTTYYPSDIQSAIDATNKTLLLFEDIQKQLGSTSNEAVKLRESWSLRLEQLKAELQQAIEAGGGEEH